MSNAYGNNSSLPLKVNWCTGEPTTWLSSHGLQHMKLSGSQTPPKKKRIYNKRKTKLELLGNLVPPNENTRIRSNDELADELRRCLLRKRYFIVIDDLWSTEAWNDLKRCFPDNYSGSRIILTTSWFLLQKNVFGEESCPPKLDVIGMQIAQYCGGLILVAGVLAKLDKDEVRWEEVAYDFW
ncbi:putative late blight resistance protein homolog R1A-3 [Solanum tuberosum]|uniref:putative late blight resistance protein homolog R1A-3 n=1 Tax=Solanum tuberosum TaxID=4113 RepID=UPI00073A3531|nr:PREDICTED: putative late blight resistance protein homolog R1A-3 [Solanum tuberosum]